ncbi:MAG TPA: radical SAM family heme chaperone HemW [Bacteroidota bacterium]|nr:radical SAM family heme chaperone HemW [Bacteroidota bacterium]
MASLYLHIPFCEKKCIYCDFYSVEHLQSMDAFVASLKKEIELYAEYGKRDPVETIFFGGGTPSLLPPKTVGEILNLLAGKFTINKDAEITLEANPGTVDKQKLFDLKAAGLNRISFGVQSFHKSDLEFLSRIHTADEATEAVAWAQQVGFTNINIDLIYALPNQTMAQWEENLRRAISLGTQHLSAYNLIVEEGTPLARMVRAKQVSPLPTDTEAEMYEFTMEYLGARGFDHYEVSNYSLPGFESRHNSNYWNHTNYIGFGPSAHSFWNDRRWWNIANIQSYCQHIEKGETPVAGDEHLSGSQLFEEAVMLDARCGKVDLRSLEERYGAEIEPIAELCDSIATDGLATKISATMYTLTPRGYLLCDEISERIIREKAHTKLHAA